jgi:hypothetical protein
VTNVPTGVSTTAVQNWYAMTGLSQSIASVTNQTTAAIASLNSSAPGVIPSNIYATVITGLGKAAQADESLNTYLAAVPNNAFTSSDASNVQGYVSDIQAGITAANNSGLTGIKNQSSLSTINGWIATLTTDALTIVNLIVSLGATISSSNRPPGFVFPALAFREAA